MNTKWNELAINLVRQEFLGQNNPVVKGLKSRSISQAKGAETLRQYFYLVATIAQFLISAMARIPSRTVKNELRRNLMEELGSRTNGESHQEILERLLKSEINIDARTTWNKATESFITGLLLSFNTRSPRYVAGMVYALEATARPELIVVGEIINLSAGEEVVSLEALQNSAKPTNNHEANSLQNFLAMHTLDFEVGHESGLRETLEEFVQDDWDEFKKGFYFVLGRMHVWWEGLARS